LFGLVLVVADAKGVGDVVGDCDESTGATGPF
jgi:hypothetical protein